MNEIEVGERCALGPSTHRENNRLDIGGRMEMALLKPLPNSPIFMYCCGRCHVALLTKMIALGCLPVYGCLLALIICISNATTVMFALLIFGSVAYSTIYGAFKGSKLCLIPFLFLQVILIFYTIVLLCMFLYAMFNTNSYLFNLLKQEPIPFDIKPVNVFLGFIALLSLLIGPMFVCAHIVYLDYVFITELDEVLDLIKELNENMSKDDPSPPHNF